jgi:ADP-ribose pyrophosphatase YjhB (NUDIX family)
MNHYFLGNNNDPHHLSVGAVLLNNKNEVACHYFGKEKTFGYYTDNNLADFYTLMRQTVSPNETLEHALVRGLQEEFGATATIENYIGSLTSHFEHKGVRVEKTTLYFLATLKSVDESTRNNDIPEGRTEIKWLSIDHLIQEMKKQSTRFTRTDLDESKILERAKNYSKKRSAYIAAIPIAIATNSIRVFLAPPRL